MIEPFVEVKEKAWSDIKGKCIETSGRSIAIEKWKAMSKENSDR